jgi:hypothetical protein
MRYADGRDIKLGDKVELWNGCFGEVVCSVDTNEYSEEFSKRDWSYLKSGVVIRTESKGVLHYIEPDEDLKLLRRR